MRVDNWPKHFNETVEGYRAKAFIWGESDCVCFAADCIKAIVGFDFLSAFRGRYSDEKTALELISEHGTLSDGVLEQLAPLKPNLCDIRQAQRGDLVFLELHGVLSCGIWAGRCALAPMPGRGLCEVPAGFVKSCWRIN